MIAPKAAALRGVRPPWGALAAPVAVDIGVAVTLLAAHIGLLATIPASISASITASRPSPG